MTEEEIRAAVRSHGVSAIEEVEAVVVDGTCVKVLAWYDNEIGYVHRMIELAQKVGAALGSGA